MHVRQQFVIFDQNSKAPLDYEIDFTKSDMLKLQIMGEGTCQIKVYGKNSKRNRLFRSRYFKRL